ILRSGAWRWRFIAGAAIVASCGRRSSMPPDAPITPMRDSDADLESRRGEPQTLFEYERDRRSRTETVEQFAQARLIGQEPDAVPRQPPHSPWARDPVPDEPPLGYAIDAVGEALGGSSRPEEVSVPHGQLVQGESAPPNAGPHHAGLNEKLADLITLYQ